MKLFEQLRQFKEKIETLVSERKLDHATKAIQANLRLSNYSPEAVDLALESYRRLGLYRIGFKLCQRQLAKPAHLKPTAESRILKYWLARYFNLRGATSFGIQIINALPPQSAREHLIASSIYFSDFNFKMAEHHARQGLRETNIEYSRTVLLQFLLWADSLAGLGNYVEAMEKAEIVISAATDNALKGVALTARGEYQARNGDFKLAKDSLARARAILPTADQSVDSSQILQWQGYTEFHLGNKEEGLKKLEDAFVLLRKQKTRPETWLDCLKYILLLRGDKSGEHAEIAHYPGVSLHFQKQFFSEYHKANYSTKSLSATIWVYPKSNEFKISGKWRYNIPLELRLASYLRLAYPFSVPLVRIASLLYPENPQEIDLFERRIHQLQRQLEKNYGIKSSLEDGEILLDAKSVEKIGVLVAVDASLQAVHNQPTTIQRAELAKIYGLSLVQARRYWTKNFEVKNA